MDDAAILREIARRIREGMDAAGANPSGVQSADAPMAPDQQNETMARLAHELRTPLSAMVAAAEIMAGQQLGPIENAQYREYAENIAASGRHALTVVDRILHGWTSPEAAALDFVQLDLNRIAERTVTVLQPIARARGQTIVADLEPRLPHLIADATSLRQILLNLLTNAVKYADPASGIRVTTRSVLDGPVLLEVADEGPGMSDDALSAARGTAPPRAAAQGTGLGLPLVRKLAAANGAAFAIERTTQGGTAVTLTFAKDKVIPV